MSRNTARLLLLLLFALLMLGYASTWITLHAIWSQINHSYSHGYLLLAASAWLSWERLGQRDYPLVIPAYSMLLLLFGCSLLWLMAYVTQTMVVQQLLLPCIIACWLAAVFGWRVARSLFFPVAILFFAIPVWDFLIIPLREIAVVVTQQSLDWLAIPALVDGFYIHLPVGTFVVAGGCSGLNYLLTGLMVGTLYAYMYMNSVWRRLVVIALVVALALLGNWVRIISLVLIGYNTEMQSSLMQSHGMYGWLIFAGAMVVFFLLARLLRRGDTARPVHRDQGWPVNWRQIVATATLASTAGLVLPLWGYWHDSQTRQAPVVRSQPAENRWQSVKPEWLPVYGGYDQLLAWREIGADTPLELLLLGYQRQQQGKELINDNNKIALEDARISPVVRVDIAGVGQVNQQLIRVADSRPGKNLRLVWWYYRVAGQAAVTALSGKQLQLQSLFSSGTAATLVAVSVPCARRDCDQLAAQLAESERLQQALQLPLVLSR